MKFAPSTLLAIAALLAAPTAAQGRSRKVDMILCRLTQYDDCKVFKDIDRQTCGMSWPEVSCTISQAGHANLPSPPVVDMPSDLSDRVQSITFYHADQCTFFT